MRDHSPENAPAAPDPDTWLPVQPLGSAPPPPSVFTAAPAVGEPTIYHRMARASVAAFFVVIVFGLLAKQVLHLPFYVTIKVHVSVMMAGLLAGLYALYGVKRFHLQHLRRTAVFGVFINAFLLVAVSLPYLVPTTSGASPGVLPTSKPAATRASVSVG